MSPRKEKNDQEKLIVNLSKTFHLTPAQRMVLLRGLSFIPAPRGIKTQKIQLLKDMQTYHRRIKLETFFEGKKTKKQKIPFTGPSDWTPSLGSLPPQITKLIRADNYALTHLNWGMKVPDNLSRTEKRALIELQKNKNIIIKPADKGNAAVILDKAQYIWEGQRQLAVTDHYCALQEPIYPKTRALVEEILNEMVEKKILRGTQREYLLGDSNPRPRRFYLLPKIHKEPQKWSKPGEIPPGRPIVSDCNSETYNTAEYIEHFLNPISMRHPSYLKDTYDFINKIKNIIIPPNALLFTIDIDSLYTNIETEAGLRAVRECMKEHPDPNRPDEYILKLLEINLTKNDFEFDSKFYLQVKGTAMGKKFAPSYANIFMAEWERSALSSASKRPHSYYRFLDDIWGVWTYSMDDFIEFTDHLNRHQRSIKIKYTIDANEVNFLDVVSFKGPDFAQTGLLDFRVYFKETDTHSLLHKNSFHPKHTFKGIIKSQLLRFKRICTQETSFFTAVKTLFSALRQRGYSRSFLRRMLKTFNQPKAARVEETPPRDKIVPLVAHFSPQSQQLNLCIKANFQKFIEPSKFLRRHRPIAAYRRNVNLLDRLVQSKIYTSPPKGRVGRCKYYSAANLVVSRFSKTVFQLPRTLSHEACNCVYLIFCTKCKRQYVGQTKNELRVRIYQHVHNITHKIEKRRHVVQHFIAHGVEALRATGLQANPSWSLKDRLRAEAVWIKKLDTRFPRGLNES